MRSPLVHALLAATIASGCHCGQHGLTPFGPDLVVVQPTARSGSDWVLDFGAVAAGMVQTGTITLQNQGQAPANVTSAVLRSGSDPAFSLASVTTPLTVGPAAKQSFTVTYTPTRQGAAVGYVDLTTNDPKLPAATIELTADGESGQVQVCVQDPTAGTWQCDSPDAGDLSIDFGFVQEGTQAPVRNVQVRNVGTSSLTYFGASLAAGSSPEFSLEPPQSTPAGGSPIAAGAADQFAITFAPTTPGNAQGAVTISTSDPQLPTVTIHLKGGVAVSENCHIDVSPASVDFGSVANNTTADQSVVGVNDGLMPCTLSTLSLSGSTAFTLASAPTLPETLAPNDVFTVDVHYAPSGTSMDMGTLTIDSSDPVTPTKTVDIQGTSIAPPPCILTASPGSVAFGTLAPGASAVDAVTLTATGSGFCVVTGATMRNGDPNFTPSAHFPLIFDPPLPPLGTSAVDLRYAPNAVGSDADTLVIAYQSSATLVGGVSLTVSVPVHGAAASPQLCVVPTRLHFGPVPAGQTRDLSFTMTACGTSPVSVTAMDVEPAGTPFSLNPAPALPIALAIGASASQTVQLVQVTNAASSARVHLHSDDVNFPDTYVDVDTGGIVAADAGEVLYSWTADSSASATGGSIYQTTLQGTPARTAFYGTATGQTCAGCHAVSPDGRYVALVEYVQSGSSTTPPNLKVVDARNGGALSLPGVSTGEFPSWRPNVNSTPAYQFVYSDGLVLRVASAVTGAIGELSGANDTSHVQNQPSWGPNGQIAFVKGNTNVNAGVFEIKGATDVMLIPEGGGTAVPLAGASDAGCNSYPEYSPNGKYIAFTHSASGQTTWSATDAVIALAASDNSGQTVSLPNINADGPNSWPTWSRDGAYLSFSSTRDGGMGSADIYFATIDPNTGADGVPQDMPAVNTSGFDHIARWAPLPP